MREIILEGTELDKLLEEGAQKLGISPSEVGYEILETLEVGFIRKKTQYKVRIFPLDEDIETEDYSFVNSNNQTFSTVEEEKKDGYYEFSVNESGLYITVYPPKEEGKPVVFSQVVEELEKHGVKDILLNELEKAVNEASGKPVKIAEYDPGVFKDAEVQVKLKNMNLEAYIFVKPPRLGREIDKELIYEALKKKNVIFGFLPEAIEEVAEKKIYNQEVLVARGVPPEKGQDAQIIYNFEIKENKYKPRELENGRVDFKELDYIISVSKGEVLAKKISPTPGKDGKTVTGEIIKAVPGKDKPLLYGKNVQLSEDGTELIALEDGQLIYDNGRISVVPFCQINGDVDYSTGNINFAGNIIINGSILDEFSVRAEGDILVKGTINKSTVEAGGSIVCKKGIIGREGALVKSRKNIEAKFVENATLVAGGSVVVERAILHSIIKADKEIKVTSRKGVIVGGELMAGSLVEADVIGSDKGTRTVIKVGIPPEMIDRLKYINERLELIEKNLPGLEKALVVLKREKEILKDRFPKQKDLLLKKSFLTYKQYRKELPDLKAEKEKIEAHINLIKGGEVRAKEVVYPGVVIHIRKGVKTINRKIPAAIWVYKDGDVTIGQYIGR